MIRLDEELAVDSNTLRDVSSIEPAAIAGAASAIGGAAKKAEETDPADRDVLRDLARESGALDPAARAYAKRLAVKEHVRMKIWQPLGMLFGISSQYFETRFIDDLATRVNDIPEEHLVTPRMSVAGPAVQGIAFTVDEPDLRSMYLNLLATASDGRIEREAHPSFAEIIRQLSSEEAAILGEVFSKNSHPMVEVRAHTGGPDDQSYETFAAHVLNWESAGNPVYIPERAMQVVNWSRLGLVHLDYSSHLSADGAYDWVERHPLVVELRQDLDSPDRQRVHHQRGVLEATAFGRSFFDVVVRATDEHAEAAPGSG